MYTCDKCGCNYDAGELKGGICDDCREEEQQLEIRKECDRKMRAMNIAEQTDGQMVLNYANGA